MKSQVNSRLAVPLSIAGVGSMFAVFVILLNASVATPLVATLGPANSTSSSAHGLKKFSSYNEMVSFLAKAQAYFAQANPNQFAGTATYGAANEAVPSTAPSMREQSAKESAVQGGPADSSAASSTFSTTNVQVAGVDEPDFLKNDGKYVYILAGDKLTIVKAYPASAAAIESKVSLDIQEGQSLLNMFLNGDRLVIFYQAVAPIPAGIARPAIYPSQPVYSDNTHVIVVDVSDRTNPRLVQNYEVSGQYSDARMIGSKVFLLTTGSVDYQQPQRPSIQERPSNATVMPDVYYFEDPQQNYAFNTVSVIDLDKIDLGGKTGLADSKTILIGSGATVYVSDKSMYIAYQENQYLPVDYGMAKPGVMMPAYSQKTIIHKISIADGSMLQYVGNAEVPGRLLNQFSMGEQNGRFSVATTSDSSTRENNVYNFDSSMTLVGKLEGLEPGESIFAARFMGDKLYLVTFQQLDPFLVIDISGDKPEVLGKLQLPGYSNYLQPYDANHVIGIGRDAVPNPYENNMARPMGLKVALFDVTDVSNPKVIDTYGFGDLQTNSEALNDHKALLFDKSRNLLVMPVSSFGSPYMGQTDRPGSWSGFYVFNISPTDGVKLKGTIEHGSQQYYTQEGSRSFFINDTLYTVTPSLMKMNDISNISHEINSIPLSGSGALIKSIN